MLAKILRFLSLAAVLVANGCKPDVAHEPTLWIIGVNGTDSVVIAYKSPDVPDGVSWVLYDGAKIATSLDPDSDTCMLVKVFQKSQVRSEAKAPRGLDATLDKWAELLKPFPVPASTRNTRADLFWSRVASEVRSRRNVRVVAVLIGDGEAEGADQKIFTQAAKDLAALPNFKAAIHIGASAGTFEKIERELAPLKEAGKLRPPIADLRDTNAILEEVASVAGNK